MLLGYADRKSEGQKASLNLIWPPLLKIVNNVFTNILTAKGESPVFTRQGREHYHQGQGKG